MHVTRIKRRFKISVIILLIILQPQPASAFLNENESVEDRERKNGTFFLFYGTLALSSTIFSLTASVGISKQLINNKPFSKTFPILGYVSGGLNCLFGLFLLVMCFETDFIQKTASAILGLASCAHGFGTILLGVMGIHWRKSRLKPVSKISLTPAIKLFSQKDKFYGLALRMAF